MATTLYELLKPHAPSINQLHKNYKSLLQLVKLLIGNIPNSDPILEIWPVSFRTYNLIVPNFLNLPHSLFGAKHIKVLMGLAMYHSSMAAKCAYCSAHSCSFTLRRGADSSLFTKKLSPKELAVRNFAEKLSQIPSTLSKKDYNTLTSLCSLKEIEAVAMAVALMGFLNKFMDATGIELEQEAINDVSNIISEVGWNPTKHNKRKAKPTKDRTLLKTDNLVTYLKVMKYAPGAIKLENYWTNGVPNNHKKVSSYLKNHTGHDFPLLQKIKSKRILKTLTTVLKDNLSSKNTVIGLDTKIVCGFVFSTVIKNDYLIEEAKQLAKQTNTAINDNTFEKLKAFALEENSFTNKNLQTEVLSNLLSISKKLAASLILAKAASYSPSKINDHVLKEIEPLLNPKSIVELLNWLSILQTMHRLERYIFIRQ